MQNLKTLLELPVIEFDKHKEDFIWDTFLHTPVMTPKFVMNKFGIDLITFAGSDTQAQRMLNTLAKTAKDYLFSRLPMNARDYQEFRLSREINQIMNYLEYQSAFVIAAVNTGSIYELYNINKGDNKPFIAGLESAATMVSTKFRVSFWERIPDRLLRVGY